MTDYTIYLTPAIESTSPIIKGWIGEERLRTVLEEDFRRTIAERMESQKNAVGYAELCPVEGAIPADYHLREIHLSDTFSVLAGIHFRNLNLDFPFVGIFASSRFPEPEEVIPFSLHLAEEFRLFRPRFVRWWAWEQQFDIRKLPDTTGDQRLLAGSIPEILALPSPTSPGNSRIVLEPETETTGYDRYAAAWEEFLRAHPGWKDRLPMTDRATFRECQEEEGLYALTVNEEYAGVIAAMPDRIHGIHGWLMIEELITGPFRGRGLAPLMQRLFIERLNTLKESLIFGTIDDRNYPSIKTALRTGRRDVGGWTFVRTAGNV